MKMFLIIISIIILGIVLFLLYGISDNSLSSENKKKLISEYSDKNELINPVSSQNKDFNGTYFTFSYPSTARVTNLNVAQQTRLENITIDTVSPRISFAAEVLSRKEYGSVEEYPSLKLRRLRNTEYTEEKIIIDSIEGYVFKKKKDGAEQTVFLQTPEYIYSFAASAQNYSRDFEVLADRILNSVEILKK